MGSSTVEVIEMECNRGLISKGFEFLMGKNKP
jgi:hypothetical protein